MINLFILILIKNNKFNLLFLEQGKLCSLSICI